VKKNNKGQVKEMAPNKTDTGIARTKTTTAGIATANNAAAAAAAAVVYCDECRPHLVSQRASPRQSLSSVVAASSALLGHFRSQGKKQGLRLSVSLRHISHIAAPVLQPAAALLYVL